ncbi:MAG: MerR family transcriptional regulator [Planctomycetia bacterium]|nr:MerR family transcriptional regulator [Planctomycetia bacterium]
MFSIGEFSKLTRLTVKTLRFYHEEGLLVPAFVDPDSGYRYYGPGQIDEARAISYLRELEFSISDIRELLQNSADEDFLKILERQHTAIKDRIRRLGKAARSLEQFISQEREARTMAQTTDDVHEKTLDPVLVAGIRMRGRYCDCGSAFGKIGRSFGRFLCGKPLLLHYDDEYHETDADFEACMPIRQEKRVDGVSVHELPGGRCVALVHHGPYDQLSRSYARIFQHIHERKYRVVMPTREVYLKGPGMIFKGNPKKYVTEIQVLIEPSADAATS